MYQQTPVQPIQQSPEAQPLTQQDIAQRSNQLPSQQRQQQLPTGAEGSFLQPGQGPGLGVPQQAQPSQAQWPVEQPTGQRQQQPPMAPQSQFGVQQPRPIDQVTGYGNQQPFSQQGWSQETPPQQVPAAGQLPAAQTTSIPQPPALSRTQLASQGSQPQAVPPAPPQSVPQPQSAGMALQQGLSAQQSGGEASPHVDVIDTPDAVTVFVDLPGCKEDDISLQVDDNMLLITAERLEEYDEDSQVFQRERPTRIRRAIQLPGGAAVEEANATYENGVAKIVLPKNEDLQKKTIGFQ